jgi:hypothetical protein
MPREKTKRTSSAGAQDGKAERDRPDWGAAFLGALVEMGQVGKAAVAAGVDRRTVWVRRQEDAEFARAYEEAMGAAATLLEDEAVRRAQEGVRRLKFNSKTGEPYVDPETGKPYVEHEYSDTLLLALLRAHLPERYRERRQVEYSGEVENRVLLTEEQREEIMQLRQAALERGDGGS